MTSAARCGRSAATPRSLPGLASRPDDPARRIDVDRHAIGRQPLLLSHPPIRRPAQVAVRPIVFGQLLGAQRRQRRFRRLEILYVKPKVVQAGVATPVAVLLPAEHRDVDVAVAERRRLNRAVWSLWDLDHPEGLLEELSRRPHVSRGHRDVPDLSHIPPPAHLHALVIAHRAIRTASARSARLRCGWARPYVIDANDRRNSPESSDSKEFTCVGG